LENLKRPPSCGKKIFVGLSGGQDSVVLLNLIHKQILFAKKNSPWFDIKMEAIHVNHNLQNNSKDFEEFCKKTCSVLDIKFNAVGVEIDSSSIKKIGLEASARRERYKAFIRFLRSKSDILALGHHIDDQIETVILQWLRGAGLEGLSGMMVFDEKIMFKKKINVWRPMLDIRKTEISEYAKINNINWINDPTNNDINLDRNFLRHKVIPLLKNVRDGSQVAMSRSIFHLQSARSLLDKFTDINLKQCEVVTNKNNNNFRNLSKENLLKFEDELVARILRSWIKGVGFDVPPTKRLFEFIRQLRSAKRNSCIEVEVNGLNSYKIACKQNELTITF